MTSASSTVGLAEDQAYLTHHFACSLCCAAGISGGKQNRCPTGQQLWEAYNQAARAAMKRQEKANGNIQHSRNGVERSHVDSRSTHYHSGARNRSNGLP